MSVSSQRYNTLGLSETWWNECQDWRSEIEDHELFRKDRQSRQDGGVTLYLRERFDYTALMVSGEVLEMPLVRIGRMENKGDTAVSVY